MTNGIGKHGVNGKKRTEKTKQPAKSRAAAVLTAGVRPRKNTVAKPSGK